MSPLFDRPPIDAISVSNTLFSSGTFRITGGAGVSVSSDASGAVVAAPAPVMTYADNMVQGGPGGAAGASAVPLVSPAVSYGSLLVQPLNPANELFPGQMTVSTVLMQLSMSLNLTTTAGAFSSTLRVGLYTRANATQLSLLNSGSTSWGTGATYSTQASQSWAGLRWVPLASGQWSASLTLTNNTRYYYAVLLNSAGSSGLHSASFMGQMHMGSNQRSGTINTASQSAASLQHFPMMGVYSSTTNALPASIPAASIIGNQSLSPFIPFVAFNNLTSGF